MDQTQELDLTQLGRLFADPLAALTLLDIVFRLILAFLLAMVIGYTYRTTHRGTSYTSGTFQSQVVITMITALLMMIIGSNIARAFALVGALSVVRFRNAVREPRELGFIFLSITIGMACGSGLYFAGILGASFICTMIYGLWRFNVGGRVVHDRVLKLYLPRDNDSQGDVDRVFNEYLVSNKLLGSEMVRQGLYVEWIYEVRMKKKTNELEFIQKLRELNGNQKVLLLMGQQLIDL